jgi:hypothetical protein
MGWKHWGGVVVVIVVLLVLYHFATGQHKRPASTIQNA